MWAPAFISKQRAKREQQNVKFKRECAVSNVGVACRGRAVGSTPERTRGPRRLRPVSCWPVLSAPACVTPDCWETGPQAPSFRGSAAAPCQVVVRWGPLAPRAFLPIRIGRSLCCEICNWKGDFVFRSTKDIKRVKRLWWGVLQGVQSMKGFTFLLVPDNIYRVSALLCIQG